MKTMWSLLVFLPFMLRGQEKGKVFEQTLSWPEIQAKALAQNKYIFVDVYASWCGPCKEMDNLVYPVKEVEDYMHEKFISIKIQIDSTKGDSEQIRNWYSIAHDFSHRYNIDALPTFLFFSPNGKIVQRDGGFKIPIDFLNMLKDAIDPDKQVYTLLENYRSGRRDYKLMADLAVKTYERLHDKNMSFIIADDYNQHYLNKLSKPQLLTKENISFITWWPNVLNSRDRYFQLFFHDSDEVDSVMGQKEFSRNVVDIIIAKEEVDAKLWPGGKAIWGIPNWKVLLLNIREKYGESYAQRIVLNAQIRWYNSKSDWSKVVKYNIIKIEKYGVDTAGMGRFDLNNLIFEVIFKHSNDKVDVNNGIKWMEIILKAEPNDPAYIDTYANLLHKIGRSKEAIFWEEKAALLAPEDSDIQNAFAKMKRGEPTWSKSASN